MNKDLIQLVRKDYEHLLEEIAKGMDDTCDAYDVLRDVIKYELRLSKWDVDLFGPESKEFNLQVIIKLQHALENGNPYLDFVQDVYNKVGTATYLTYREFMHDPGKYKKLLNLFAWYFCSIRETRVDYDSFSKFMNKPEQPED